MTPARLESSSLARRRAIALAALLLLTALGVVAVIWPAMAVIAGQTEWRADATERLGRYRALSASRKEIEEQLHRAQTHPLWNGLLSGTDAAAATNVLQGEFRGLLDAQRIAVQSSSPLDALVGPRITRVGVRLNIDVTIDQLQMLLERVRVHAHLLVLDNLIVTAPQNQSPEQNASLNVQLEVWGFIRSAPTEGLSS